MASIVHLTSAHPRDDIRIFVKMCRSAAAAGFKTSLIVADGYGDDEKNGVRIFDAGPSHGRINRMFGTTWRVLTLALEQDADLYHLHDPELLLAALILKNRGKRVVFDAHEDLPSQILSKPYLHPSVRRLTSVVAAAFERFASRRLDAVVAATPAIRDKFQNYGVPSININNFPMFDELATDVPWTRKEKEVCYVGGIAAIRGIKEVISAMALCNSGARLNLVGEFSEPQTMLEAKKLSGWASVNPLGFRMRMQVREYLGRSVAGIVTFLPVPNHIEAQPNKMFEYMSAGLPVIASDFPLWREIIEGSDCGICVDPLNPSAIASAIDRLVSNPNLARRLGENGRRAVKERYNWSLEEARLLEFYNRTLLPT